MSLRKFVQRRWTRNVTVTVGAHRFDGEYIGGPCIRCRLPLLDPRDMSKVHYIHRIAEVRNP